MALSAPPPSPPVPPGCDGHDDDDGDDDEALLISTNHYLCYAKAELPSVVLGKAPPDHDEHEAELGS